MMPLTSWKTPSMISSEPRQYKRSKTWPVKSTALVAVGIYESMSLIDNLISLYETSEGTTVDEFLTEVMENDQQFSELSIQDRVELKRRFLMYINSIDERSSYDEYESLDDRSASPIKKETIKQQDNMYGTDSFYRKGKRRHRKYVEAFINNISVPRSLEEMSALFMDGNDAQNLVIDTMYSGRTSWSVPRWAKRGDIVLFMHAKTANSTLTRLRTEVRTFLNPNSAKAKKFEQAIADQLSFHKEFGGKIYAVGRVSGRPERDNLDPLHHSHSKLFCDIDSLFLLSTPVDISEFNSYIHINRLGGITPVYGEPYEKLKATISGKNTVPEYFSNSFSTPFPHNLVNRDNWMQLGIEYRNAFTLEIQFRQCYVDYLLQELGDQKKIYMECPCYKGSSPVTFVDNVIRFNKRLLPVEVKLNIKMEVHLEDQCEQYCMLDRLVLNKKSGREARSCDIVSDRVLVIDTFAIYMFKAGRKSIEFLYDLDALKSKKEIQRLREIVNTFL